GKLDPDEARQIVIQVALALDYLHSEGFVHRDIKPSNILLTREDDCLVAKLTDLGLIRGTGEYEARITREGTTVGTVDYVAPEQARARGAADVRGALYSLGCTLFHMLSGGPPFTGASLAERVLKHLQTPPPDLCKLNPAVSENLQTICWRL